MRKKLGPRPLGVFLLRQRRRKEDRAPNDDEDDDEDDDLPRRERARESSFFLSFFLSFSSTRGTSLDVKSKTRLDFVSSTISAPPPKKKNHRNEYRGKDDDDSDDDERRDQHKKQREYYSKHRRHPFDGCFVARGLLLPDGKDVFKLSCANKRLHRVLVESDEADEKIWKRLCETQENKCSAGGGTDACEKISSCVQKTPQSERI